MRPQKDRLPLELQHCYMEIHRKEQNLTPLLNQVRNDTIDEYEKSLPSIEEIRLIIVNKELTPTVCEDSGQAEWTVGESLKLAKAIHNRIGGGE